MSGNSHADGFVDGEPTGQKRAVQSKAVHVYARGAALCVEPFRGAPEEIVLDIALAEDGRFDWANKVSIKLDTAEQMRLIAVFSRQLGSAAFVHGKGAGQKRLVIEQQGDKFYVNFSTHKGYALPVDSLDAGVLILVLATSICERFPKLSSADVISIVRMSVKHIS